MAGGALKKVSEEERRVADLLRRDRIDRAAEVRRIEARIRVSNGDPGSLADAAIGPTPEWLERTEHMPVTAGREHWTEQTVKTVRRVVAARIFQLHNRGVLDDDTFAAARWYRTAWDMSGLDGGASIAAYGSDPRGEKAFGMMPRTETQAEARADFRFAQAGLPSELAPLFDRVVLHEDTLADAARATRQRYANATAAFRLAASLLHGRISHLLPVR
jgi:hypothetical protein